MKTMMRLIRKLLFREAEVYLIFGTWVDPSENKSSEAVGESMVGYVTSQQDASSIASQGGMVTKEQCWAVFEPIPKFRFERAVLPITDVKTLKLLTVKEALNINI